MKSEKIRVLGISASPRAVKGKSHSDSLLLKLLNYVDSFGGESRRIVLAEKKIAHCEGCYSDSPRKCVYPCVHEDDTDEVLRAIYNADALVLAFPVNWLGAQSRMQVLIEKITALENNRWEIYNKSGVDPLEGKPFAVISSKLLTGASLATLSMILAFTEIGLFPIPYGFITEQSSLRNRWVKLGLKLMRERRFEFIDIQLRLAAKNLVQFPELMKKSGFRFDDNILKEKEW